MAAAVHDTVAFPLAAVTAVMVGAPGNVAGVTGIVLTKLDGTAKGGIAVAIAHELNLPIRYVGVGEAVDDLLPFSPRGYVDAIFQEKW